MGAGTGLAGDAVTVQSGECWIVLLGRTSIGLAIVIHATKTFKGGLRPEASRMQPHLLSETVSL